MPLTDSDVADLAREAVDRKDPDLEIRIEPLGQDDPYRLGTPSWVVHAGGVSSYLTASMSRQDALDKLVEDLAVR